MPRRSALLVTSDDLGWLGVTAALGRMVDVDVLAETASPDRARDLGVELRPDVILSASRIGTVPMPRVLLDLQRGPCHDAKIVLFSAAVEADDLAAADGLRLAGWLLWTGLSVDTLHDALRVVFAEGLRVGSDAAVDAMFAASRHGELPGAPPTALRISVRERTVLRLLALDGEEELTVVEIAHRLGVRPCSVATYVNRLACKLDLAHGGRRAVVAAARHRGLVG